MKAFESCGNPRLTVKKVRDDIEKKEQKKKGIKREHDVKNKGMVVLTYASGVSEKIGSDIQEKGNCDGHMNPHTTLKSLGILVHPKDKTDPKDPVYIVDCQGYRRCRGNDKKAKSTSKGTSNRNRQSK